MKRADSNIREINELLNDAEKNIIVTNDQTIIFLGKLEQVKALYFVYFLDFHQK